MILPKKSLGQNFLRDENIIRKIIEQLQPCKEDTMVEIGPGSGALTKHLVEETKKVIGVEIDDRASKLLEEAFENKIRIIKKDVLNVQLKDLVEEYRTPLRVVGNIPYYITSDILFWLFENRAYIRDAVLMVQIEVAQRLTSAPRTKEYGILSVFSEFYSEPKFLFRVSRNCFYPKPKVDSAVVSLDFQKELPIIHDRLFRNIVRGTFGKRRKTLYNGLKYLGFEERNLKGIRFDLTKRPEELSLDQFLELVQLLHPFKNEKVMSSFLN